jgi:hypothetical protein
VIPLGRSGYTLRLAFESQSHACMINVRMALSTSMKGDMPISNYIAKMKGLADRMAFAGKRLDDEDLVCYILAGLDSDFDGVISAVSASVEPITVAKLYGQLPVCGVSLLQLALT